MSKQAEAPYTGSLGECQNLYTIKTASSQPQLTALTGYGYVAKDGKSIEAC